MTIGDAFTARNRTLKNLEVCIKDLIENSISVGYNMACKYITDEAPANAMVSKMSDLGYKVKYTNKHYLHIEW